MKIAKINYRGIKDVTVVPQVFVCVDRNTSIKRDIHIWHQLLKLQTFHVFVNCFIIIIRSG